MRQSVLRKGFERYYDVRTGGDVYLDDLGLEETDRNWYNVAEWVPLDLTLRSLGPGPSDVFVDMGTGKGLPMIVAGRFPFKRVIGVELAEELAAMARANVDRARPRLRAGSFAVVNSDATQWTVPDDVTIAFFYNPFTGDVFSRAIDRLIESYDRAPRSLRIVYSYPWEHNRLLSTGRVVVDAVRPMTWPPRRNWAQTGWVTVIYRIVSREAAAPRGANGRAGSDAAMARWSRPNDHVFRLHRAGRPPLVSDPASSTS